MLQSSAQTIPPLQIFIEHLLTECYRSTWKGRQVFPWGTRESTPSEVSSKILRDESQRKRNGSDEEGGGGLTVSEALEMAYRTQTCWSSLLNELKQTKLAEDGVIAKRRT